MAITAATATTDFSGFLNPSQSAPIFEEAARRSVVQSLVRQVPLGGNGVEVPVVTGKLSAGWVSEAGQKPASESTMALKTISPKKIASIAVVSAEVVRANPGNYMNLLRPQMAEAFALAFDQAALHDAGPDGTATAGPFSTYIDQSTKAVEVGTGTTIHNDFVAALSLLVNDGKKLRGFAIDDIVEPLILDEVDSNNRPIYTETISQDNTEGAAREGRLIGRTSYMNEGVATVDGTTVVGYAGDWSQAAWGVVGGISYKVSTEATVTINGSLVSLFENNLVAILGEAEYGFLCNDPESFVKLTNAV